MVRFYLGYFTQHFVSKTYSIFQMRSIFLKRWKNARGSGVSPFVSNRILVNIWASVISIIYHLSTVMNFLLFFLCSKRCAHTCVFVLMYSYSPRYLLQKKKKKQKRINLWYKIIVLTKVNSNLYVTEIHSFYQICLFNNRRFHMLHIGKISDINDLNHLAFVESHLHREINIF